MMAPRIEELAEKKLVGQRRVMSLTEDGTTALWQAFMPARASIRNRIGTELYLVQRYDRQYFERFNPAAVFEKWACVEVTDFSETDPAMETLVIPSGLYAVFRHKGGPSMASSTYRYIFTEWLPQSAYALDHRPHIDVLADTYRHDHPESEEDIWIPVRRKAD